jgi:hypothetical protein
MARALLLLAMLLSASGARADGPCPAPELASLVADLTAWIETNSALDTAGIATRPPEIMLCAPQDTLAYGGASLIVEDDMLAAYDRSSRRIYLVEWWDISAPRAIAALLHELVHAAQFDTLEWDCHQAAEWQAYRLQAKWLAEQGIDAGFDWGTIALRSLCPSGVHP